MPGFGFGFGSRIARPVAHLRLDLGVAIAAQNGVSVEPTATGYRVTKTAAGNAYVGAAVSALIEGDFLLSVTPVSGSGGIIGMTPDPAASNGFADLPYALSKGATAAVYENGTNVAGFARNGAIFIARTGSELAYGTEGNLAARVKTGVTAALGLRTSLYEQGEAIDVRLEA